MAIKCGDHDTGCLERDCSAFCSRWTCDHPQCPGCGSEVGCPGLLQDDWITPIASKLRLLSTLPSTNILSARAPSFPITPPPLSPPMPHSSMPLPLTYQSAAVPSSLNIDNLARSDSSMTEGSATRTFIMGDQPAHPPHRGCAGRPCSELLELGLLAGGGLACCIVAIAGALLAMNSRDKGERLPVDEEKAGRAERRWHSQHRDQQRQPQGDNDSYESDDSDSVEEQSLDEIDGEVAEERRHAAFVAQSASVERESEQDGHLKGAPDHQEHLVTVHAGTPLIQDLSDTETLQDVLALAPEVRQGTHGVAAHVLQYDEAVPELLTLVHHNIEAPSGDPVVEGLTTAGSHASEQYPPTSTSDIEESDIFEEQGRIIEKKPDILRRPPLRIHEDDIARSSRTQSRSWSSKPQHDLD